MSVRLLDFYQIKERNLLFITILKSEEDRKKILHLLMEKKIIGFNFWRWNSTNFRSRL